MVLKLRNYGKSRENIDRNLRIVGIDRRSLDVAAAKSADTQFICRFRVSYDLDFEDAAWRADAIHSGSASCPRNMER